MNKFYLQVVHHDCDPKTRIGEICIDDLPFQPLLLERLAAIGFVEIKSKMFTAQEVDRVQRVLRIRQSLGVNLSGAAIIVELLERMEEMQEEIERWRHA